ncbi:hypothetical protein V1264_001992 [Littorina saxatilis]|uniref:Uncharacterized protein n=2 Tax=Littorina saxatilis TaxID=31220 RepID=A0AAN9GPR3_9CAEN
MRTGVEKGEEMPQCDEVPRAAEGLNENNWAGTLNGCCNTRMRVELPQRVTSVITGQRHRVLQFTSSSQLVHTGYCQNEGGMCVLGGRCTTVYRIQWLLVRASPIPTALTDEDSLDNDDDDDDNDDDDGDDDDVSDSDESDGNMFVPAMVSNHCQCVFN